MRQTLDEIRQRGLEALRRELGRAGTVRFLQQFENGTGDYARERHAWVDQTSLDDIRAAVGRRKRRPKK
jgi:hypothetical protein